MKEPSKVISSNTSAPRIKSIGFLSLKWGSASSTVFICSQPVVLKDLFGKCWVKFGRMKAWTSNGFPILDFSFNWTFPELYVLWTLPIPLTVSDCFWRFNFIRCTASSDMRLIWEPLSRRARQLMILLESSSIETIAVGKMPILDGSNACPETSVLVLSMRVPAFSLWSKELCLPLQTLQVLLDLESFVRWTAWRQLKHNLELKTFLYFSHLKILWSAELTQHFSNVAW